MTERYASTQPQDGSVVYYTRVTVKEIANAPAAEVSKGSDTVGHVVDLPPMARRNRLCHVLVQTDPVSDLVKQVYVSWWAPMPSALPLLTILSARADLTNCRVWGSGSTADVITADMPLASCGKSHHLFALVSLGSYWLWGCTLVLLQPPYAGFSGDIGTHYGTDKILVQKGE